MDIDRGSCGNALNVQCTCQALQGCLQSWRGMGTPWLHFICTESRHAKDVDGLLSLPVSLSCSLVLKTIPTWFQVQHKAAQSCSACLQLWCNLQKWLGCNTQTSYLVGIGIIHFMGLHFLGSGVPPSPPDLHHECSQLQSSFCIQNICKICCNTLLRSSVFFIPAAFSFHISVLLCDFLDFRDFYM